MSNSDSYIYIRFACYGREAGVVVMTAMFVCWLCQYNRGCRVVIVS